MAKREVRMQSGFLLSDERPIVRLGDVGRWSMVRHADFSNAAPFVISRKEWDRLKVVTA